MKISKLFQTGFVIFIIGVGVVLLNFTRPTYAVRNVAVSSVSSSMNNWWDDDWDYRVLITVNAAGYARQNKPAEVSINFTPLLNSVGAGGSFDPNSIRVIEIDDTNNVLDPDVPFQFDQNSDYNAATKAAGTLVWLVKGSTNSNATRRYHVYFDVTGKGFTPPSFTPLVTTTDNVTWAGYQSIRLVTQNGTYYYHKPGGGFASLIDAGNYDWISWNTSTTPSGAAGDFRGIPNMVFPSDGGFFHPGRTTANTTLVRQGPLKASFRSTNNVAPNQGEWEILWEVYPTFARMTVTKAPALNYWFLYEGTPGGSLDLTKDTLTRSDGSSISASQNWTTDIPSEEWLFVTDPDLSRSIYFVHHQDDNKIDGYYAMDGLMTVFGFGRSRTNRYLTGTNRQFTFGLVNSTNIDSVRGAVYNAWKNLTITVGDAEINVPATPTATVSPPPTITATATPPTPVTPTTAPTITPTAIISPTPTATATPTTTPTGTGQPPTFRLLLPLIINN